MNKQAILEKNPITRLMERRKLKKIAKQILKDRAEAFELLAKYDKGEYNPEISR